MYSGGWSFWSFTATRRLHTRRSSPSCFKTGSAVRFPTNVTWLTAGAEALIFGSLLVGIRWLTEPEMPARRPSGTELFEGKGADATLQRPGGLVGEHGAMAINGSRPSERARVSV